MGEYLEIKGDIFDVEGVRGLDTPSIPIVHCISSDYALGAGIAKQIEKLYSIKHLLREVGKGVYPDCLVVNNIINMVTKSRYWNKPTYLDFERSLIMVSEYCLRNGVTSVIMPKIGSGLDKLEWGRCKQLIKGHLCASGINVTVYYIN